MVLAVSAIAVVVFLATGNDDSPDKKSPSESSKSSDGRRPTPSLSLPTEIPTRIPTRLPSNLPSGLPSELPSRVPTLPTDLPDDISSLIPTPSAHEAP
ncbi:hypothetical protein [Streptomyces sp. G45]|uniref:hypothetical protein n=1 Tax=Streptomyces sp. G45 TaxID=3406627 RepID=UPI003C1D6BEF